MLDFAIYKFKDQDVSDSAIYESQIKNVQLLLRARTLLKIWRESRREGHSCFQQWRTILQEDCHQPLRKLYDYPRPSTLI